jgi:hypothetical protein
MSLLLLLSKPSELIQTNGLLLKHQTNICYIIKIDLAIEQQSLFMHTDD